MIYFLYVSTKIFSFVLTLVALSLMVRDPSIDLLPPFCFAIVVAMLGYACATREEQAVAKELVCLSE